MSEKQSATTNDRHTLPSNQLGELWENEGVKITNKPHENQKIQADKTIEKKSPARFTHASRNIKNDEESVGAGNLDTHSWTYKGGSSFTKRIGKSFLRIFGNLD